MTNKSREAARLAGPITNTGRKEVAYTIFSDVLEVVSMAGADVVHLDNNVRKKSICQDMFWGVTTARENHGLPTVNTTSHAPPTERGRSESVNNWVAF